MADLGEAGLDAMLQFFELELLGGEALRDALVPRRSLRDSPIQQELQEQW